MGHPILPCASSASGKRRQSEGVKAFTEMVNNKFNIANKEVIRSSSSTAEGKVAIVKKLMPSEIQERRKKGLCYTCDERYEPSHKCKRLFLLDSYSSEWLEEVHAEVGNEQEVLEPKLKISLRAVNDDLTTDTMRWKQKLMARA